MVFNTFWKKNMNTFYALKAIYNMFNQRREEEIRHIRMIYNASRIKRRFGKVLSKLAPTFEERLVHQSKYAFNSIAVYLHDPTVARAKYIFGDFIEAAAHKNIVYSKCIHFWHEAEKIVNFYKER